MYPFIKRFFDILLSFILLVALSPFLIPICIALKLTGEGYIFYFQKRMGYKNKPFDIWKFATMLKDSPNIGSGVITLRNDPRVTPVGKFLRKTKINELPQIINVLLGDMSIVGPRPVESKAFYALPINIQDKIYNLKPGITGIGSIVFRNEEELISAASLPPHDFYREHIAPYKGALELWYQAHASMATDLKIIFLTAWQIFSPNSELVFNIFKDLPPRPAELKIQ